MSKIDPERLQQKHEIPLDTAATPVLADAVRNTRSTLNRIHDTLLAPHDIDAAETPLLYRTTTVLQTTEVCTRTKLQRLPNLLISGVHYGM